MFSQELTMEVETFMPQGVQTSNSYFGQDFVYINSSQVGEMIFLTKGSQLLTVNHTSKELSPVDVSARIAQAQQMTAMLGELKLKETGKTKKIKGLVATQYKLSNVNGMAPISGKVYSAEIDVMNMEKFKTIREFQDSVNPFKDALKNKKHSIIGMVMSVETGQGMPMDIESKVTKYETKLDDKIKAKVKEIRAYRIVEAKKKEVKAPTKQ